MGKHATPKYQGINIVEVIVESSQESEHVDYSTTGGYVGELRYTLTKITARDSTGRAIASEQHRGSHPMTTDNYTKKLEGRIRNGGGSWFGEDAKQLDARLDREFDAAHDAGGEVLAVYKDKMLAETEARNNSELRRIALGLSPAGRSTYRSQE